MQVVPREKPMTVFQCVGYIYKNAGLKGFARGYLLCFGREPLAFATYFGSFELMTKWVLVYVTILYWEKKISKKTVLSDDISCSFFIKW